MSQHTEQHLSRLLCSLLLSARWAVTVTSPLRLCAQLLSLRVSSETCFQYCCPSVFSLCLMVTCVGSYCHPCLPGLGCPFISYFIASSHPFRYLTQVLTAALWGCSGLCPLYWWQGWVTEYKLPSFASPLHPVRALLSALVLNYFDAFLHWVHWGRGLYLVYVSFSVWGSSLNFCCMNSWWKIRPHKQFQGFWRN